MGKYTIETAKTSEQIKEIARLGNIVWHEHYDPIIGSEQVEYMVKKFQSEEAIESAIKNAGYIYYCAYSEKGDIVGYCGIQPEAGDGLFLSKLYVDSKHRKRGIASMFLKKIDEEFPCIDYIYLTVNRNNKDSIEVYKHFGFLVDREEKSDIGSGFFMDDYIMIKKK